MDLELDLDFDAMSDDEIDAYFKAQWAAMEKANPVFMGALKNEVQHEKTLLVNPHKAKQIDQFLKCLSDFISEYRAKRREPIKIRRDVSFTDLMIGIDSFMIFTSGEKHLHKMLCELIKLCDSIEIVNPDEDVVRLCFCFDKYYIEIPCQS